MLNTADLTARHARHAQRRSRYPLLVEVGLVLSLLLIVALFRVPMTTADTFEIVAAEQEVVLVEEIEQTRQVERPPPPPAAPAPIEVADDVVIDEQVLDLSVDLDLTERVALPSAPPLPPPPAPAAEAPRTEEAEVFVVVETPPTLIGGLESIQRRVVYPEMARLAGIEGTAYVQFVIDEQGQVTNPFCVKDPGGGLCEAALDAVREARFTPGEQRGRAVKVQFVLPVRFRIR